MKGFLSAVSFLTIIKTYGEFDAKASVKFFPLIGLLIGCGLYGLSFIKPPLNYLFMLIYLSLISGGLHLDGLADTSDAFFSHKDKQKILQIMKDSRIGTFGSVAILFTFLIKIISFGLIKNPLVFLFVPAYSRFSTVYLMKKLPYARETGTAKDFFKKFGFWDFFIGYIIAIATIFALNKWLFFIFNLSYFIYIFFIYKYFKRKIGAVTGDMLGFAIETTESFLLIICALWFCYV